MVDKGVYDMSISLSMWNKGSMGIESKSFLKVYETTVKFPGAILGFLNCGLECKDVINSLVLRLECNLSSSSMLPLPKLPRELQVEGCNIELQKQNHHK